MCGRVRSNGYLMGKSAEEVRSHFVVLRGRRSADLAFNSLYIILRPLQGARMAQNRSLFSTQLPPPPPVPPAEDFKKQRALYLAQRKARQREAQQLRKQQFGKSSSSEDEAPQAPKQPVLIKENYVMEADGRTDSSGSSPKQQESLFRTEREKYKQERMARRQQAIKNRKIQFGSSSSSEDEVPIHPRAKIVPQIKMQLIPSPKSAFRQQDIPFGFVSLDLNLNKQQKQPPPNALLATVRLKDKKQVRERYQVETLSNKGVNIWTQKLLEFRENSLALGQRTLPLYDINKAKMIIQPTQSGSLKIKLTVGKQQVFLAASPKKLNQTHFVSQYYFIFARIVALKLQIMGRKTVEAPKVMKAGVSEKIIKEARVMGKVRKNSFFGGWEEQLAVVTNSGLAIYKEGKEKATLTVNQGSVRQIWTRFQFQRDNLVLKFLNGSSKVELSVPVENFLSRDNWLYQLYSLTPK